MKADNKSANSIQKQPRIFSEINYISPTIIINSLSLFGGVRYGKKYIERCQAPIWSNTAIFLLRKTTCVLNVFEVFQFRLKVIYLKINQITVYK